MSAPPLPFQKIEPGRPGRLLNVLCYVRSIYVLCLRVSDFLWTFELVPIYDMDIEFSLDRNK